jgi:hypothetical protein
MDTNWDSSEFWVPIVGWPSYSVSSLGRVCRVDDAAILQQSVDRDGYFRIKLSHMGKRNDFGVHRLVCAGFHGQPLSDAMQAAHGDGDRKNNCASNLRWATAA